MARSEFRYNRKRKVKRVQKKEKHIKSQLEAYQLRRYINWLKPLNHIPSSMQTQIDIN